MMQVIIKLVGVLLVLLGVVLIYDARIITKRFFGFGDQNDGAERIENIRIFCYYYWWISCVFCMMFKAIVSTCLKNY